MIEEPPPLPFPSLNKLKAPAKEILDAQRNPTSPDIEIKFFQPGPSSETDKKKQRPNKKACDICKKKKVKCDNNATPNEVCTRTTCLCIYHVQVNVNNDEIKDKGKSLAESLPPTASTRASIDNIPSTTVFRKPGLLYSGHYAGETSFCGYLAPDIQPQVIIEENQFPTFDPIPPQAPFITKDDQLYLIDVYYENLNPFFPTMNKAQMILQLQYVMNGGSTYLSPLFFYALFARAAHIETDRQYTQFNNQSFNDLGDDCTAYVSALSNCYKDKPRISTVLALVIMANHLEQTKLPEKLTRSWLWAGEAFRIALDLGVHRSLISEEKNEHLGQLCVRTFWLAYITDCTISMTYGRPSATEEKVLDVTSPKRITSDDDCTAEWLDGLNSLISLSKIAARVIKFNYCPPPPFKIQGPIKRHNAFLASVDSWLTDIMHPNSEPDSPISSTANIIIEDSIVGKRMAFQKKMFLYTNLILLHRPYVNDSVTARNSTRPSYDICTFAAIIITDAASKLDTSELIYHSKSPMIAYALVMALRVHIMNASTNPSVDKFNAEKNFIRSVATIDKLPQCQNQSSLLYEALADLKGQYHNRFELAQEREEEIRVKQAQNQSEQQMTITPVEAIFNPGSTEKRKERPCSAPTSTVVPTEASSSSSASNNLSMKYYQPPDVTTTVARKKKKANIGTPQPPTFVDNQQKQKHKQKRMQQLHQHVFSTNTTVSAFSHSQHNKVQKQQQDQQAQAQQQLEAQRQQQQLQQEQQVQQEKQQLIQQQQQLHYNNNNQQMNNNNNQFHMQQQQQQQQQQFLPQAFASGSTSPANSSVSTSLYSHMDFPMLQQQQQQQPFLMTEPQMYQLPTEDDIFNLGFFSGLDNSNIPSDMSYDTFMENYSLIDFTTSTTGSLDTSIDNTRIWCVINENNSGVSITPATGYSPSITPSSTSTTIYDSPAAILNDGSPLTTNSYPASF